MGRAMLLWAGLACAALALAGCGDGRGARPTAPPDTPAATASSPTAASTLTVAGTASPPTGGPVIETSVAVTLVDNSVSVDKAAVDAGTVRFIATNASSDHVHELAVLKVRADGSFATLGQTAGIEPQQGGALTIELEPGVYQLACLIAIGQSGSVVDHYQQGEHTAFTVR